MWWRRSTRSFGHRDDVVLDREAVVEVNHEVDNLENVMTNADLVQQYSEEIEGAQGHYTLEKCLFGGGKMRRKMAKK